MKFEGVPSRAGRVERKEIRSFGELESTVEYQYDASGRVVRETTLDPEGNLMSEGAFEYDNEGRKLRERWNDAENGRLGSFVYTYDENGEQIGREWEPENP